MKWRTIDPKKLPQVAAIYRAGTMVYGPGRLYTNGGERALLNRNHPVIGDPVVTHYLPVSELLLEVETE